MLSEDMFKNRAVLDNPWWNTGTVAPEFEKSTPRHLLSEYLRRLLQENGPRRAVLLMGPRRVGKTWLMQHAIRRLLDGHDADPGRILYFSLDVPVYHGIGLEELVHAAASITGADPAKDRIFAFFDEIQYLKDWETHLKALVDAYPNIRFAASGSAASALATGSRESGAGRFSDLLLGPLSFREFVELKGLAHHFGRQSIDTADGRVEVAAAESVEQANKLFVAYANAGGYPELVLHAGSESDAAQLVQRDIVDKVLLRDLPSLYHVEDVRDLQAFFSYLAFHTGSVQSYESLSMGAGLTKHAVGNFLHYLEDAFLVVRHDRIDVNASSLRRAMQFKLYLTNASLRAAMFQPVLENADPMFGNVVETAVSGQLGFGPNRTAWRYANWKKGRSQGEVDFVRLHPGTLKPEVCIEVKWSDGPFDHVSELDMALDFVRRNGLRTLWATTRTQQGTRRKGDLEIQFVPTSLLAYSLPEATP